MGDLRLEGSEQKEGRKERAEGKRKGSGRGREGGGGDITRQTILPHLRQSLTRSLAQVDTLPDTRCPASPRMCHLCPGFSPSEKHAARPTSSRNSFSHRSVCRTRRLRYCNRLARICRHVRDKASRVFRSTLWASWVTMLDWR